MVENKRLSFSDWLVVSDIDGTLNTKARKLPKRNYEAVREFVEDYSGHFTLASGRSVQSLEKHYKKLPISETPAIVMNGAGIYDFSAKKMIDFSPISEEGMALVCEASERFPLIDANICTLDDNTFVVGVGVFGGAIVMADKLPNTRVKKISEVPKENWGKVAFTGPPSQIRKLRKHLYSLKNPDASFMLSSIASFEVLAKGTNKGSAVLRLADILGIDRSHTCAIGDYFNDEAMLRAVGISAVCGQAPKELKAIADYVACHCNKGAVADFLNYIQTKATKT